MDYMLSHVDQSARQSLRHMICLCQGMTGYDRAGTIDHVVIYTRSTPLDRRLPSSFYRFFGYCACSVHSLVLLQLHLITYLLCFV